MKRRFLAAISFAVLLSMPGLAAADVVQIPVEEPAQAGASEDNEALYYTIVKDDTLWDISKKFLRNPFKWPGIWKLNPYIKNPDLIYPGDVVRITPDGVEIIGRKEAEAVKKELPVVTLDPGEEKVIVLEPEPAPVEEMAEQPPAAPAAERLKSHSMAREGFISEKELKASGAIIGPKEHKILMNHGDEVYVSFKDREGLRTGDRFTVFTVGKEIKHPVRKYKLGNIVDILGSITITGAGDVAEARVDSSYKEIPPGARLAAYRQPVAEVEVTSPDAEVNGYVVASIEATENLTRGDIAYIDKGSSDGLKNGNLMRIFRKRGSVADPVNKRKKVELPPVELGTLVVVEANENTSSCLVVKSLQPIVWGDQVSTLKEGQQ